MKVRWRHVLKACQKNREDRFQSCSQLSNVLKKCEIIDRTIYENDQNKTQTSSINDKTAIEYKQSDSVSINTPSKKIFKAITIIKTISFFVFLLIVYLISKNEAEARDLIFFTNNDFDYWQYYRLEFTRGAAIVSFIFIGFTLLYITLFFKKLINLGHEKWMNIFRLIASIVMFAWSILLFTTTGGISVYEVQVAWYVYIILETILSINTLKNLTKY